jgi:hypothetical protein
MSSFGAMIKRSELSAVEAAWREGELDVTGKSDVARKAIGEFAKFGDGPYKDADNVEHPEYTASFSDMMEQHEAD